MVLCLLFIFLAVNFDWSIILIQKSFGASRHISVKLGVKLAIARSTNGGARQSVNMKVLMVQCFKDALEYYIIIKCQREESERTRIVKNIKEISPISTLFVFSYSFFYKNKYNCLPPVPLII